MSDAAKSQEMAVATATSTLGWSVGVFVGGVIVLECLNDLEIAEHFIRTASVTTFGAIFAMIGGQLVGWLSHRLFFGTNVSVRAAAIAMALLAAVIAAAWIAILDATISVWG